MQTDVVKYGFKDIVEWNTAIMNVSFAYGAILEDQEQDIRAQIDAVRQDKSLRSDKKLRIIASLTALIPKQGKCGNHQETKRHSSLPGKTTEAGGF